MRTGKLTFLALQTCSLVVRIQLQRIHKILESPKPVFQGGLLQI